MDLISKIFLLFVKISVFSFGGGYVAFPIINQANDTYQWMNDTEISNILSIAGMSPGPVAINAAVGLGYNVAGIPGLFAAFLGIAIPCSIIVTIVASFFFKIYKHPAVKNVLYILRSVITGIILYAGIDFAFKNGIFFAGVFEKSGTPIIGGWDVVISSVPVFEIKSLLITITAFLLMLKTKIHPILIIVGGGILGIFIF
jgi:chromate transporter